MKCMNCGVGTLHLQRHDVTCLPAYLLNILAEWLTITECPEDGHICNACFLLLIRGTGNNRLLGHHMVCLDCGRSVKKIRHHVIELENPLLLKFTSTGNIPKHPGIKAKYACRPCWTRFIRQSQHLSSPLESSKLSGNMQNEENIQHHEKAPERGLKRFVKQTVSEASAIVEKTLIEVKHEPIPFIENPKEMPEITVPSMSTDEGPVGVIVKEEPIDIHMEAVGARHMRDLHVKVEREEEECDINVTPDSSSLQGVMKRARVNRDPV